MHGCQHANFIKKENRVEKCGKKKSLSGWTPKVVTLCCHMKPWLETLYKVPNVLLRRPSAPFVGIYVHQAITPGPSQHHAGVPVEERLRRQSGNRHPPLVPTQLSTGSPRVEIDLCWCRDVCWHHTLGAKCDANEQQEPLSRSVSDHVGLNKGLCNRCKMRC